MKQDNHIDRLYVRFCIARNGMKVSTTVGLISAKSNEEAIGKSLIEGKRLLPESDGYVEHQPCILSISDNLIIYFYNLIAKEKENEGTS